MSSQFQELIVLISAQLVFVGTGLMTAYFKLKSSFQQEMKQVKNYTEVSVQKLNGLITSLIHSFDRPAWLKIAKTTELGTLEFRMLELNEEFCEEFGIKREDYIGKTDEEAGINDVEADVFRKNDLIVWASGEPQTFEEPIAGKKMSIRKMRVQSRDGKLKGIFAYLVRS